MTPGWTPQTPAGDLKGIWTHELDGQLQFHRVSREVNSTKGADRASMAEPINPL